MLWNLIFVIGLPLLVKEKFHNHLGLFGVLVASYGFGNVLSNITLFTMRIRRRLFVLCFGKMIMASGFFMVALAPNAVQAAIGCAVAAIGGPMGDVMILTTIHRQIPPEHRGKVYSLSAFASGLGATGGLLLAPFTFSHDASAVTPISYCSAAMFIVGLFGVAMSRTPRMVDYENDNRYH
jgi:predicted MFS family arabinose efflux permease